MFKLFKDRMVEPIEEDEYDDDEDEIYAEVKREWNENI